MNEIASRQPPEKFDDLRTRVSDLERQLEELHSRNKRVETNKSWETSRTRLLAVTFVTYVTMTLVFEVLDSTRPMIDALVPTTGFLLSTLSLPFVRGAWEKITSKS